jgi:drug/metabolite transporter (DMT)-like permease
MSLSPRHEHDSRPIPPRPYRDSALLHGALAVGLLVVSALTDTELAKAAAIAGAYFVAATAWSWFRFRQRIRAQEARARAAEEQPDA